MPLAWRAMIASMEGMIGAIARRLHQVITTLIRGFLYVIVEGKDSQIFTLFLLTLIPLLPYSTPLHCVFLLVIITATLYDSITIYQKQLH